jgi:PAS domain S-box-containing protein
MHLSRMGGWDINLSDHTVKRTQEHDRIFGYEASLPEWSYDIFLQHVLAEDRTEVDRSFREALAAQADWNFECRIRRTDSEVRWIWVAGRHQRNDQGEVRRMSGIVQDITELRRLDEALQEKNAALENARLVAEQANLAKSIFLSRMSHELRTPLNAILGFTQLLETGSPPLKDSQIERLQQISKAGWYLLELINEILDLSLIESGKLTLLREPVSLAEVMRECQAMIESQAQTRGIQVTFLPVDDTWHAQADRTRLKQVIVNLLSNAIKYNRAQGTVEVKCTCTPERICISIKDSGVGLPAELQKQLFQPFNRLGQEGGAVEGTGIGLVVTKQLVEQMGGSIGVKSTAGVGSDFRFELIRAVTPQPAAGNIIPVDFAQHAQGNTQTSTPGSAAQRNLLYVEDNPANLMLVEQIIAGQPGLHMLSARDGNFGIALARTHLPDVILMDVNLPGISGIEAMNILRQDPATAHIPIVALSANAMLHDKELGLEAGFIRYLTKPIKVNELLATLDEVLELSKRKSINTNETGQIS